jgi:hypothetical protein
MIDEAEKRISALSMFENEILPKWEDVINENGGEFRMDFKANLQTVQKVWDLLVYQSVTQEFKEADMLCGVRLLDKSREGRENNFRVEIWTKFAEEKSEVAQNMKKYIEEKIMSVIQENEEDPSPLRISFSVHKSTPKQAPGPQGDNKGGPK